MTEREMKATALNKKEDRVLQKTYGTLNLEMSFTYNVIALHVRTVKANFRRLRERVEKLKSYLTPEEITALRQLEEEGKFKPATSFNVNAAMKIAAAARRLNLYPEGLKRSKTAIAGRHTQNEEKLLPLRAKTEVNLLPNRRNSVTGVFIDAPPLDNTVRRNSTDLPASTSAAIRPVSAAVPENHGQPSLSKVPKVLRPASSDYSGRDKSAVLELAPQKSTSETSDGLFIHQVTERVTESGTGKMKSKSPRDKMATMNVTDDTLDSGRAKLFEDRRQELLQDEQIFLQALEKRKKQFIGKVDEYLEANPPAKFDTPLTVPIYIPHAADDEDILAHSRRRRNLRQYDVSRTYTSEEDYQKRQKELWKDMNKTRYLRVPDEKIDLSGVVTLAKDQMQLYNILKTQEPVHLIVASN